MREKYEILGVSEEATTEELEKAYKELKSKYSEDRFLEGEIGNLAAKKLTQLENAYSEIKADREGKQKGNYHNVEKAIRENNISLAQEYLDEMVTRDANWHYLQSVVYYKKNWINESKKQLEIAMSMEPNNTKYSDAYTKLNETISYNDRQFRSGNANVENNGEVPPQQMGGTAMDGCCSWCATMCCMNALLNICCHC